MNRPWKKPETLRFTKVIQKKRQLSFFSLQLYLQVWWENEWLDLEQTALEMQLIWSILTVMNVWLLIFTCLVFHVLSAFVRHSVLQKHHTLFIYALLISTEESGDDELLLRRREAFWMFTLQISSHEGRWTLTWCNVTVSFWCKW